MTYSNADIAAIANTESTDSRAYKIARALLLYEVRRMKDEDKVVLSGRVRALHDPTDPDPSHKIPIRVINPLPEKVLEGLRAAGRVLEAVFISWPQTMLP